MEDLGQPKKVILIADDDKSLSEIYAEILEDEGYTVKKVESARAAIDVMTDVVPDLVILDVVMHGGNGFDIYEYMRVDFRLHNVPVIFISGATQEQFRVRGLRLGAEEFLSKPFQLDAFKEAIHKALNPRTAWDI